MCTIPGALGRLCRRYGWLAGAYIALSGLGLTVISVIARVLFGMMGRTTDSMFGGISISGLPSGVDPSDIISQLPSGFGEVGSTFRSMSRAPIVFADLLIVLGVLILLTGVILAAVLKKKLRVN